MATTDYRADDPPIGELLTRLANDTSTLLGQEMELAQAEAAREGRRLLMSAEMFAMAFGVGLAALGAFTAAAILGIATVLDAWIAALIVGGGLLLITLILIPFAIEQVRNLQMPDEVIDELRDDAGAVAAGIRDGRQEARHERQMEEARHAA